MQLDVYQEDVIRWMDVVNPQVIYVCYLYIPCLLVLYSWVLKCLCKHADMQDLAGEADD
jgi:hypothetical protein